MGLKKSKLGSNEEEDSSDDQDADSFESFDYGAGIRCLPFSVIQRPGKPFDDSKLRRWIPNCPIRISFKETCIREMRCWYTIKLQHGCFQWKVEKRFRDFLKLHSHLQVFRAMHSLHLPEIKLDRERSRSSVCVVKNKVPEVPSFPSIPKIIRRPRDLTVELMDLERYFKEVLQIPVFRDFHKTTEFLEVGPFSFVEDLGHKEKEGFVRRRSDCGETRFGVMCTVVCGFWKKRWLFVKDTFVGLVDPSCGELEVVMLLDRAFRTKRRTRYSDVLVIRNLVRKLIVHCKTEHDAEEWLDELNFVLERGKEDFLYPNLYDSFAPSRLFTECKWIVDGATYFDAVAIAMDSAKEEIFIAGWWLSPEVYLRRPSIHGHYWQLDYLLRRKARQGVKIYVLLYRELELAVGINSLYSEKKLSRMHRNIKVLRHPALTKGVLLWAHHEKIVCVDQTYAFIGGIDLCYGRWDDYQHRLTDLGDATEKLRVKQHMSATFKPPLTATPRKKVTSLPDVTEKPKFGQNATTETMDSEKSEKSIPNFKFKSAVRKYQAIKAFQDIRRNLSAEDLDHRPVARFCVLEQPADQHRAVQEIALVHLNLERKFRLWQGKDYANFINKDFENLNEPYNDSIDRNTTPRMPWHDVGIYTQGMVARDIARHFILRWNDAKLDINPEDHSKPLLIPKSYHSIVDSVSPGLRKAVGSLYRTQCQVLRSLSLWSGGIQETEDSIHKAYLRVIRESQKFIYIENQFFISQPNGSSSVFNGIADALFNRILKAHRDKEDFHVYVVLPLLPAFEGEIGTDSGSLIMAITHWNSKSIYSDCDSLTCRLSKHIEDTSKYINFYGLRTHGILEGNLVTELVYVHSKILLADDQVAIIGSANINDRSMLGYRDSEIAVIVRDTNFLHEPEGAGQFCYSLRRALFKEHLGLMHEEDPNFDLQYPSKMEFVKDIWMKIALRNTEIYEEVFRSLPTDSVTNFAQLKEFCELEKLANTDARAAAEKLRNVRGYIVMFPLLFLSEENLLPHYHKMERYIPRSVFT